MYNNNKSYNDNLESKIEQYRVLEEESEKFRWADRYRKMVDYRTSVQQLNKFAEASDKSEKGDLFRQSVLNINQMEQELKEVMRINLKQQGQIEYMRIQLQYDKPDKDLIEKLTNIVLEQQVKLKKYEQ